MAIVILEQVVGVARWPGSQQTAEELDASDRSCRLVDVPMIDTRVNWGLVDNSFGRVDEVVVGSCGVICSQTGIVNA